MPIAAPAAGDRILNTDLGAFYNLLKGVAGSGETITLVYNAAGVIALIPSSDPAASTQFFQIKNAASTVKSALTAGGGALFSSQVNFAKGSDIASAGTTDLSTITGNYAQVSGTTTITAFGTVQAGTIMVLEFQGVLTLTYNATSLILQDSVNYTTAAGDVLAFVSEGSGNWREVFRRPATGITGASGNNLDQTNLWMWFWRTGLTIETTLAGTGAYNLSTKGEFATLSTGATSASSVGLRQGLGAFLAGNSGAFEVRWWSFTFATDKAASEAWRMFMTDEDASTQPSLTAKHLGMRFDGTTCSFSTADGTTEQTTDVTAQITANQDTHCVVTFDGTTAKLYIDGTLRATHATNVPTTTASTRAVFRAHIVNSAAADKTFLLSTMHARLVA